MQLCGSLSILWHCLSLGLGWKLTFPSPVATAEFSKFGGILSAALSQHHFHFNGLKRISSGDYYGMNTQTLPSSSKFYRKVCQRWQEYTQELYKKDLNDPDTYDDVITHLEPDILECEVKWALGSITTNKASDGILVLLFQFLKDDAVKVLHSICQQIWKTQQWPQDWERSVFIPIPKKGNAKECSTYCTIAFISHASKVILKIL